MLGLIKYKLLKTILILLEYKTDQVYLNLIFNSLSQGIQKV